MEPDQQQPFYRSRDYWIGVSQNVVGWALVVATVIVVERYLVGRPIRLPT